MHVFYISVNNKVALFDFHCKGNTSMGVAVKIRSYHEEITGIIRDTIGPSKYEFSEIVVILCDKYSSRYKVGRS